MLHLSTAFEPDRLNLLDAYYASLSRITHGNFLSRLHIVGSTLYGWPYKHLGKPRLGLMIPDAVLGWRARPNITTTHPSYEFLVNYTTNERGERSTGSTCDGSFDLSLYGCSWTFGHGVHDEQTFAARLTKHGLRVQNRALLGYGPTQALLMMRQRTNWKALKHAKGTTAYIWVPDQLIRAWRRKSWIELNSWVTPGRANHPVYDFEHGKLQHQGLIGASEGVLEPDSMPGWLDRVERVMTGALLAEMQKESAAQGVKFIVIIPPVPTDQLTSTDIMRAYLKMQSVPTVDLSRKMLEIPDRDSFYALDGHPKPMWHARVCDLVASCL